MEAGTVEAAGRVLPVTVRVDPRAKRLILRVTGGGVRVTCPSQRHLPAARRLVQARRGWIAEQEHARPAARSFTLGQDVPVLGRRLTIAAAGRQGAAARIDGKSIVTGGGDRTAVARRVERLLRRVARDHLTERSNAYAAALGLPRCPVGVRQMRSRWGSCSAAPAISYDWRLIFAPLFVSDYVCAHEVAHRVEMNHSPSFWAIVSRLEPDYGAGSAWLRENGPLLHAYGAAG